MHTVSLPLERYCCRCVAKPGLGRGGYPWASERDETEREGQTVKKIGKLHVPSPSPSRRLRPTCINHEALSTTDSEVGVQKRHLSLGSGHGGGRTRAGVQEWPANPPAMCLQPTGQCGVLQSQTATATMLRTSYCQVRRLSNARTRWQGRGEGWVAVERDTINESYVPSGCSILNFKCSGTRRVHTILYYTILAVDASYNQRVTPYLAWYISSD